MTKHLHERRKITFQEYGALLATRELLKRGDLKFIKATCGLGVVPEKHLFTMSVCGDQEECGSIGCIGGNMAMIMNVDIGTYVQEHKRRRVGEHLFGGTEPDVFFRNSCSTSLGKLFFPPGMPDEWDWITPKIAVKAIDSWLKTGKPEWVKLKKSVKPVRGPDYRIKRHK